jgi:ATP-binding cassette subfamily B protein
MSLVESMPSGLRAALGLKEGGDAGVRIALAADLAPDGRFGVAWLVVAGDALQVYDPPVAAAAGRNGKNGSTEGRWEPRIVLDLRALTAARTDSLVGGGALVVTTGDRAIELVRYTNARQRVFSRAGKFLADAAAYYVALREKKEPLPPPPVVQGSAEEPRRCDVCGLILPEGSRVCPACVDKGQVLWRILGYLRPYRRQTLLVSLLMLSTTLLSLVSPYLTRPLMDRVLAPEGTPAPVEVRLRWLALLVLGMLAAQVLSQTVGILRGRMVVWLGTNLGNDLRSRLYEHLQRLSLRFFDKRPTGTLIARVTRDTESLENVIMEGAQFFVANILLLVGIGIVLFTMNWRLTLLILIPVPVVAFLSRWFWERIHRVWDRYWHARQQITAVLNDSLAGIRVVRAFAQEPQEVQRFAGQSRNLFTTELRAERTWATFFPVMWFLISTGTLIVWYVGGRQMVAGTDMTIGKLTAFVAYLGMFYGPLQFLSRLADYLARSLAAAQRVFEILDHAPDVPDAADAAPLPRIEGRVEFRQVTFGYDAHKPVLQQFALDVRAGEMIGLVGHSGAGKSTTINLLCRFYDPQEGEVRIDGVDVRRIAQHDLRSQIGVVLQDTFLFNGTIAENIGYAKPGATREEVMAAAKTANAHDFIVQKPDGYDTAVGERGQALSAGERQRVAIARAVLHNPRILILDEATSSVDTDTERQIQEAIARLTRGRTTFAIAHRLSTLRNADRLVVLKSGTIEEIGTHDELMARKGEFHRLVQMQMDMSRIQAVAR